MTAKDLAEITQTVRHVIKIINREKGQPILVLSTSQKRLQMSLKILKDLVLIRMTSAKGLKRGQGCRPTIVMGNEPPLTSDLQDLQSLSSLLGHRNPANKQRIWPMEKASKVNDPWTNHLLQDCFQAASTPQRRTRLTPKEF